MDDGNEQVEELTLEPTGSRPSTRRRALWGVLTAGAVVVGALVVTSGGEDATAPGLPVALGSSVADREASGAAADAMLAWVTYVPGDDLPALGGRASAYRLAANVTEDQVRALAGALELEGDPVQDGPSWTVSDGSGYLDVYDSGVAQWWFSSTAGVAVRSAARAARVARAGVDACAERADGVVTECAVTPRTDVECDAAGGACTTPACDPAAGDCTAATTTTTVCGPGADCVDPAPPPDCAVSSDGSSTCADVEELAPVDLPSEDEARAIAIDLLTATGLDVDDADVTVERGYDAWYVSVEPRLDGLPTGLVASVSVGAGGAVTSASGHLADPERLGEYPLLDTRATIERANALSGVDGGAGEPTVPVDAGSTTGGDTVVTAATVIDDVGATAGTTAPACKVQPDGTEICESTGSGITCPQVGAPDDEPLGAPETPDCTPPVTDPGLEPEPLPAEGPLEVVLVDASPVLVPLGAADGSTDAYLVPGYRFTDESGGRVDLAAVADSALTTPPTTDTSAVEPPVTATVAPDPCEVLVEEDASGTTHTVQPDPDCLVREPQRLAEGEQPQIGVGYYVDVQTGALEHCGFVSVELAGTWWWVDGLDGAGWAEPTEGGTVTLVAEDRAEFVGRCRRDQGGDPRPVRGPWRAPTLRVNVG